MAGRPNTRIWHFGRIQKENPTYSVRPLKWLESATNKVFETGPIPAQVIGSNCMPFGLDKKPKIMTVFM
jgi:hypothetical protein